MTIEITPEREAELRKLCEAANRELMQSELSDWYFDVPPKTVLALLAERTALIERAERAEGERDENFRDAKAYSEAAKYWRELHQGVSAECPICGGDCAGANPPVYNCPAAISERDRLALQSKV